MIKASTAAGAICLCAASLLSAQTPAPAPQPATRKQIINELVVAGMSAATHGVTRPFQSQFGSGGRGEIVAYLVAAHSEREGYKALLEAMEARALKQVGSAPTNKGTTSLAMKGLVPEILGVALETGAINREVNGTTLTFRVTPAGIIKALQGQGLVDMYADYSKNAAARFASRFSAAASFDTSKGPSAGSFTGDQHQLTNWSIRAEVVNQRDPASPEYAELWSGLLRTSTGYTQAAAAIDAELSAWPGFRTWEGQLTADTDSRVDVPFSQDHDAATAGARFRSLLEAALPKLEKLADTPAPVIKALDAYVAQLTKVQSAIDNVYDFVAKGTLVTFDWSTSREPALPDLYTATAVWETALGASRKTDLTVNAAVNFYRTQPMAVQHQFKSFDLTAQLDHPLGSVLSLPAVTLTVAGRYSRLPNDTVAPGVTTDAVSGAAVGSAVAAVAPHGNIGIVQAKLTIPVKGSGLKIPLSVTASNRTELIKERDVRASFGVTFDLDALIGGLFPKP